METTTETIHPVVQHHADVDWLVKKFKDTGKLKTCCDSCTSGACCDEAVYVDNAEAQYILDSLTPEHRARVTERTKEWLRKAMPLLSKTLPDMSLWRPLRITCPFLEDRRCSIYDQRPFSCRTHFAYENSAGCELENRATQKFASFPEEVTAPILFNHIIRMGGTIEHDHFGVFLAEALLGIELHSGSYQKIILEKRKE